MVTAKRKGIFGLASWVFLIMLTLMLSACGGGLAAKMAKAEKYFDHGQYRSAEIEYKVILQQKPNDPGARLGLGKTYLAQGQLPQALIQLNRAKKLGALPRQYTLPVAQVLIGQRHFSNALKMLKTNQGVFKHSRNKAFAALLRGDALVGLNRLDEATRAYQSAAQTNPHLALADVGLAEIAARQHDLAGAREAIDKAIAADGKSAPAWMFRGNLDLNQGALKDADIAFRKVVSGAAKHRSNAQLRQSARQRLALVAIRQGKPQAAHKILTKLIKENPKDPVSNYLLALVEFQQKNWSGASDHLLTSIQVAPKYVQALALLGLVRLKQGQAAQAQMYLSSAVSLAPGNPMFRQLLADAQLNSRGHGNSSGAATGNQRLADFTRMSNSGKAGLASLRKRAQQSPANVGLQFTLAQALIEKGQSSQALSVLKHIPDSRSANGLARDRLEISAYLKNGNLKAARKAAERMLKNHPQSAMAYVLTANVYMIDHHDKKAEAYIRKAKALAPHDQRVLMTAAILDLRDGNTSSAKQNLESLVAQSPKNLKALMLLAQLAAKANNAGETLKWLNKAREAAPKSLQPVAALVKVYTVEKQPKKALSVAQEAVNRVPHNGAALNLLALTQWASGKRSKALTTFAQAVKAAPNNLVLPVNEARAQLAMKQTSAAEATLKSAIAKHPRAVPFYRLLALVQLRNGDTHAALATAQTLQTQGGTPGAAGLELAGDLHMEKGAFSKAVNDYRKAQKQNPSQSGVVRLMVAQSKAGIAGADKPGLAWLSSHPKAMQVRQFLGQLYLQHGKLDAAAEQFRAVMAAQPRNLVAINNLAWIYGQQHKPGAEKLAMKAHQLAPDSASVDDTLAWIELGNGHNKKALALLQEATQKAPKATSIHYHLAVAQAKNGQIKAARKTLQALLGQSAQFADRAKAQALLKKLSTQ